MATIPITSIIAALAMLAAPAWGRTWTVTQGQPFDAAWVRASDQAVTLRRTDGVVVTLPLKELSPADQDYVAMQLAVNDSAKLDYRQLNKVLGVALFAGDNLWGDNAALTAERVRLADREF